MCLTCELYSSSWLTLYIQGSLWFKASSYKQEYYHYTTYNTQSFSTLLTVKKPESCWKVLHLFIWDNFSLPNTPGIFHQPARLFCFLGLQVCYEDVYVNSCTRLRWGFMTVWLMLVSFSIFYIFVGTRILPANSCQGFGKSLWIKATAVRCGWLLLQGDYFHIAISFVWWIR